MPDQIPHSKIAEAEEGFRTRALIGYLGPFITFEKRNVPFDCGSELGVICGFSSAQRAITYMYIHLRMSRHSTQDWRHVLDRVRAKKQHSKTAFRHKLLLRKKKLQVSRIERSIQ